MMRRKAKSAFYLIVVVMVVGLAFNLWCSLGHGDVDWSHPPAEPERGINVDKQRALLWLTIVATLVGMMACGPKEAEIPFETIERADFSGAGEFYKDKGPKLVVIAEAADIDALGNTVSLSAQAQLRDLNYEQYLAIIAFQGWRPSIPTPQSGVEIQRISRKGSTITIYAQFYEPVEHYVQKAIVTSPYHVVSVRKNERLVNQKMRLALIVDNTVVAETRHFIPERPRPTPIPSPTPTSRPCPTAYPVPVQTIPALTPRSTYAYPSPAAE